MTGTLGEVVEWWARATPDRPSIRFPDDAVTSAELHGWTSRVAADLVTRGLAPGDRVGVFGANSLAWCIAAVATMKAGAILVPLNYRYAPPELASVVAGCTPKFMFVDDEGLERTKALAAPAPELLPLAGLHQFRTDGDVPFSSPHDPDAPIVIAYTSGSTSQPKGVMFSHRSVLAYAFEASLNYPQNRVGAKAINVPPLFTGGGTVQLIQFLIMGMTIFIDYDFDPERILKLLIEEQIEIFCGVPTFFERIAALPQFADADLSHIQFAAVGGARVPVSLLKTWLGKGVVLRQLYGLTEGGGNTSVMASAEAVDHPEQCGHGGIFTKHRIMRPDGSESAPNEAGEIWVRGPGMMIGYWGAPEATAQTLVDGWLRTGDIGMVDEAGNITLVDRMKDMIISGGLNIWPIDIENVIQEIDGVIEVAVIAAKDERFGETPMAIIHSDRPLSAEDVVSYCNDRLGDYKVPRYIVFEPSPLPRLATGKLSKRELKDRYADAAATLTKVR